MCDITINSLIEKQTNVAGVAKAHTHTKLKIQKMLTFNSDTRLSKLLVKIKRKFKFNVHLCQFIRDQTNKDVSDQSIT